MYNIIKSETVEPYMDNLKLTVKHVHNAVWNKKCHELWYVNRIIYPVGEAWEKKQKLILLKYVFFWQYQYKSEVPYCSC